MSVTPRPAGDAATRVGAAAARGHFERPGPARPARAAGSTCARVAAAIPTHPLRVRACELTCMRQASVPGVGVRPAQWLRWANPVATAARAARTVGVTVTRTCVDTVECQCPVGAECFAVASSQGPEPAARSYRAFSRP